MKIGFYGAAKQVTGSKHLITLESGKKILLDCGLFQGRGRDTASLNASFGFNPQEVDYMILSHAHIDHSGLIPKLVKEGFKGKIYCTSATRDLCELMLQDSAHIQESDVRYINKRRRKKNLELLEPLYTKSDAVKALDNFHPLPYNETYTIDDEVKVTLTDTGHMLGSSCIHLQLKDGEQNRTIAFTGDIGRYSNRILRKPQPFKQADYIIAESTYGNRLHEKPPSAKDKLLKVVKETCVLGNGKLLIPAFSVGRTQEIVSVLNDLEFEGKLPKIPVYVDSPLAVNATDIMRDHPECFNDRMIEFMKDDPDPFGFNDLHYIKKAEHSKALNNRQEPCIIISSSGMIEGGRIKHHLMHNIEDQRNTILMVGYCSRSSLGGRLINGQKDVTIYGVPFEVKASIEKINPFSAHGDFEEMMRFLSCQEKDSVKRIFLVHGDEHIMEKYKERLDNNGFQNIHIPDYKMEVEI